MSKREYFPGVSVDVDKLSAGLLELIEEHPDGACMTLGMFPASIMKHFDDALKEKIPDAFYTTVGDEYHECDYGASLRQEITKDVCAAVLGKSKTCIV